MPFFGVENPHIVNIVVKCPCAAALPPCNNTYIHLFIACKRSPVSCNSNEAMKKTSNVLIIDWFDDWLPPKKKIDRLFCQGGVVQSVQKKINSHLGLTSCTAQIKECSCYCCMFCCVLTSSSALCDGHHCERAQQNNIPHVFYCTHM